MKRDTHINNLFSLVQIGRYLSICVMLCFGLMVKSQDANSPLTVIGNVKGVPASLSMAELKSVFMAEKQRWPDGTKVIIAMIKSTAPLGKIVSKRIYSMTGDEVRGFWAGISFAGKFESPLTFNTASELESYVSQTPGAVAILDKSPEAAEVKTVLINGKKTF
jgi:hypothetical protein